MKWIGLTGGIATGKSTVSELFKKHHIPVIDADLIAKEVVSKGSPGLLSVVNSFGPEVLSANKELDRKKLAGIVFNNKRKLIELENIIHPLVQFEVQRQRQQYEILGNQFAIYDVPLLFEKNMQQQFDFVIVVTCSETLQIQRLKGRNQMSDEEIKNRLDSQLPLDQKKARANFVIDNDKDLSYLEKQVILLVEKLKNISK